MPSLTLRLIPTAAFTTTFDKCATLKLTRSYGFGGGIDLIEVARPKGDSGVGVKGGGGGIPGPAFYARYNYYSLHTDTKDHVLWPWHEWEKENR